MVNLGWFALVVILNSLENISCPQVTFSIQIETSFHLQETGIFLKWIYVPAKNKKTVKTKMSEQQNYGNLADKYTINIGKAAAIIIINL